MKWLKRIKLNQVEVTPLNWFLIPSDRYTMNGANPQESQLIFLCFKITYVK